MTEPDLKLDPKPTDQENGGSKVRPFNMESDDEHQLNAEKDSMQSFDSENEDASTRNILNGCPIKGQRRPSKLIRDFAVDKGTILHCIYEEPSPSKASRDKSSPKSKKEHQGSPAK